MNYKEITELLKLISDSHLSEFKIKDGDFELSVKTDKFQQQSSEGKQFIQVPIPSGSAPAAAAGGSPASGAGAASSTPEPATAAPEEEEQKEYLEIKSPMVGTFYRSPSPDKPPFVKIGGLIEKGDVVCIVEAMKLFNEIESEISGKIVKVLVDDAAPVEYDQTLFLVEPDA